MNCVARFTNETWHFTLASDFHGKKATILKEQIKQNVGNIKHFYFSNFNVLWLM